MALNEQNKRKNNLLEYISDFPKWKLDALMLDDTDLKIRKQIEKYKRKYGEDKEMKINLKKLTETSIIPTRQHEGDAGYDLYADILEPITIDPHMTVMIHTGIAVEIPEGYFGAIFARSGLASKQGLRPANCTGVIDNGYTGECMVALHNDSAIERGVSPGDRIAQLVVMPYLNVEFDIVDELSDTERGDDGFGSTGR